MNFHNNLVKPLQLLDWKIFECLILTSLNVDFQEPMFISKVMPFDHIVQGKIGVSPCILCDVPNALTVEPCFPVSPI